jgi:hypothetical protein
MTRVAVGESGVPSEVIEGDVTGTSLILMDFVHSSKTAAADRGLREYR